MKPTLFFYCNALSDDQRLTRGIDTDSPAGTRKVVEIAHALQSVGVRVVIVSMGRGRADNTGTHHPPLATRLKGVPILYGPMVHRRYVSELFTLIWLAITAMRLAWRFRAARHLFYNQLTAYLPALVLLRTMRRATLCDIEDGRIGRAAESKLPTRGNAPPWLFSGLISHGAMLACSALNAATHIRPTMECYGAVFATGGEPRASGRDDGRLVVIMTGMFDDATGVDLLIEAFRGIEADPEPYRNLRFELSGFGPRLECVRNTVAKCDLDVIVHERLNDRDYARMLQRASIGLSLKAVAGPYANTTFPSKVIEYAQHRLCLIATDISDVRRLFGDVVRYVTADDPAQLLSHLRWANSHRQEVGAAGARLRSHVEQDLGYGRVGSALRQFIFGSSM
jgi:glycosyltransferase involved in cell wall biosynthesis